MKTVFTSTNNAEVETRRALLDTAGIPCNIHFQGAGIAYSQIQFAEIELVVLDASRIEEARQLLAEYEKGLSTNGINWKCAGCGEESEPQFTECWSCGKSRTT